MPSNEVKGSAFPPHEFVPGKQFKKNCAVCFEAKSRPQHKTAESAKVEDPMHTTDVELIEEQIKRQHTCVNGMPLGKSRDRQQAILDKLYDSLEDAVRAYKPPVPSAPQTGELPALEMTEYPLSKSELDEYIAQANRCNSSMTFTRVNPNELLSLLSEVAYRRAECARLRGELGKDDERMGEMAVQLAEQAEVIAALEEDRQSFGGQILELQGELEAKTAEIGDWKRMTQGYIDSGNGLYKAIVTAMSELDTEVNGKDSRDLEWDVLPSGLFRIATHFKTRAEAAEAALATAREALKQKESDLSAKALSLKGKRKTREMWLTIGEALGTQAALVMLTANPGAPAEPPCTKA